MPCARFIISKQSDLRVPEDAHVVDENMHGICALRDQLRSIILVSGFLDAVLQVPFECLFSPRAFRGVGDRCKSGCGAILLGFRCQIESKSSMTSH